MKKTALTILFAGALFCAGCSDSTKTTAGASPTPVPELTAEQMAAIKNSEAANKAAERKKKEELDQSDVATAVIAPAALDSASREPRETSVTPTP